jgi:hypothetical protein
MRRDREPSVATLQTNQTTQHKQKQTTHLWRLCLHSRGPQSRRDLQTVKTKQPTATAQSSCFLCYRESRRLRQLASRSSTSSAPPPPALLRPFTKLLVSTNTNISCTAPCRAPQKVFSPLITYHTLHSSNYFCQTFF